MTALWEQVKQWFMALGGLGLLLAGLLALCIATGLVSLVVFVVADYVFAVWRGAVDEAGLIPTILVVGAFGFFTFGVGRDYEKFPRR
ncbi:MAG: hypothetical protein ACREX3_16400 [Gammaproteobacteria bacterium]